MSEAFLVTPHKNRKVSYKNKTYTVRIDNLHSDPSYRCSYLNDATKIKPLCVNKTYDQGQCEYGGWKGIIDNVICCRPCLYKNGRRVLYLNPNNYAYDINGNPVDITSGAAGDVMIEFKKQYYRWRNDGDALIFEITTCDKKDDRTWTTAAFVDSNGNECEYMYYSAYEGFIDSSGKLRSISGVKGTEQRSPSYMRTAASLNGMKYQQEEFSKRFYVIGLMVLVSKSTDGQSVFGNGVSNRPSGYPVAGVLNGRGLFWGTASYSDPVKIFGIENFWGSYKKYCDGIVSAGGTNFRYKDHGPYDRISSYSIGRGWDSKGGCACSFKAISSSMIYCSLGNGQYSSSYYAEYYTDIARLSSASNQYVWAGGGTTGGVQNGPFSMVFTVPSDYEGWESGARLCAN